MSASTPQQATEKALEAGLVMVGVEIPLTHDVDHLVELAEGAGCEPPEVVRAVGWLSPWAVQLRYEGSVEELDRSAAMAVAAVAVDWARALTRESDAWPAPS